MVTSILRHGLASWYVSHPPPMHWRVLGDCLPIIAMCIPHLNIRRATQNSDSIHVRDFLQVNASLIVSLY